MPKAETILQELEMVRDGALAAAKNGGGEELADTVTHALHVLEVLWSRFGVAFPHYPIIPCGDSSVVLAVDREELEADVTDGVEVHFDEVGNITHVTYDAHAIVAAILAKLDLREVEDGPVTVFARTVLEVQEKPGGPVWSDWELLDGDEIVTLKPSPTSKERKL